jgi:N-dimethylarginine dimethylaminohydrolase
VGLLERSGAQVSYLPADERTGLDSLYPYDPALMVNEGAITFRLGKEARGEEGRAMAEELTRLGIPVLGEVREPGSMEGGDLFWLDPSTLVVARSYRTNPEGIAQLHQLLSGRGVEIMEVDLPHWRGAGSVFHLLSLISLSDRDLAVVFSPLLPIPLRQELLARGFELIETPEEEFETMGCNVLTLEPRRCLMLAGNPITKGRLEEAGCEVWEYEGGEISLKGSGGPTCLTRPLWREEI